MAWTPMQFFSEKLPTYFHDGKFGAFSYHVPHGGHDFNRILGAAMSEVARIVNFRRIVVYPSLFGSAILLFFLKKGCTIREQREWLRDERGEIVDGPIQEGVSRRITYICNLISPLPTLQSCDVDYIVTSPTAWCTATFPGGISWTAP